MGRSLPAQMPLLTVAPASQADGRWVAAAAGLPCCGADSAAFTSASSHPQAESKTPCPSPPSTSPSAPTTSGRAHTRTWPPMHRTSSTSTAGNLGGTQPAGNGARNDHLLNGQRPSRSSQRSTSALLVNTPPRHGQHDAASFCGGAGRDLGGDLLHRPVVDGCDHHLEAGEVRPQRTDGRKSSARVSGQVASHSDEAVPATLSRTGLGPLSRFELAFTGAPFETCFGAAQVRLAVALCPSPTPRWRPPCRYFALPPYGPLSSNVALLTPSVRRAAR